MTTDSDVAKPRAVEELINNHIPYSEMTEEEIALCVDWHAQVKARDAAFEQAMADQRAAAQEIINQNAQANAHARSVFDELVARALGGSTQ